MSVSTRAEARKALAQFARLYPSAQRGEVIDIVAAYGVRCILNEVALEQLSPERLATACEDSVRELPSMLKPRPRGGRGCVKQEPPSRRDQQRRNTRRVRRDASRQFPFVDDDADGVAGCMGGDAARDASKFLEAAPAEQARRARGVFAALRTQPNRLLRSAAGPALEEVAGRHFPVAEVRLLLGDHYDDVTELQFLKAIRRVAKGGYDVPEDTWADSLRGELTAEPEYVAPTSAIAAFARPTYQPALEAPPPKRAPRAWALPLDAPTVSTAAKQLPLARRRANPAPSAWVSEARRNVSRKTPRYLGHVESKIKDQLDAHRARLKRERAAGRDALGDSSNTPRAVDIADAFLRSEGQQWDSTLDDDAALDEYGLPAEDAPPVPDYQPPKKVEGAHPDYSSWVGDYGPVNARGEKVVNGVEEDDVAVEPVEDDDIEPLDEAAVAADDDDVLDEAFLQELAGDSTVSAGEDAALDAHERWEEVGATAGSDGMPATE